MTLFRYTLLLSISLLSGCSLQWFARNQKSGLFDSKCFHLANESPLEAIYVINHGWHTGITLDADHARRTLNDFIYIPHNARWIEFGWGDAAFYRASGYSLWKGLRAAFFSSGSALHIASFREAPEMFFAHAEIVRIPLNDEAITTTLKAIKAFFSTDTDGRPIKLGESLYGTGNFYAAAGDFSLWNTCNSWTAQMLAKAGCPIRTDISRSSSLMRELGVL